MCWPPSEFAPPIVRIMAPITEAVPPPEQESEPPSSAAECASRIAKIANENENAVIYVYGVSHFAIGYVMDLLPNATRVDLYTVKINSSIVVSRRADIKTCRGDVFTHVLSFEAWKINREFYHQCLVPLSIVRHVEFM